MITSSANLCVHNVAELAKGRLKSTSYRSIRGLTCECDNRGVLHLRGRLPSYYLKQLAQEAVIGLPGVTSVVNQAEVVEGAITHFRISPSV